jgi:[protein-PII] uridylyltransferase
MAADNIRHARLAMPRSFAALLDRRYERSDFLQAIKDLRTTAQDRIRQEHEAGARGRNVVRHLTALVDDVVRTIFQYVLSQASEREACALLAIGGYGRGELNPYSDIDLMFLCNKVTPDHVVRETLYLLWDVGYTLGHSVRTRRDATHMAEADLTARTAMMEARFIDGDTWLFHWFQEEICHRHFTQRRRRNFARQKSDECRQRHASFANTVNLMEPNIKESPGGLRDYHTALWLGMAAYEAGTLTDFTRHGLITPDDQQAVEDALDFMFRVRNAVHYRHGRKNDLLSVDIQEKIAAELGFKAGENKQAVEHFLKTYYLHANVISDLCCTLLEAVSHLYQPWFKTILSRSQQFENGFSIVRGHLAHTSIDLTKHLQEHPVCLMQAFAMAQKLALPLAPDLSRAIKGQANAMATDAMRRSAAVKNVFWQILSHPQAAATLRAMHRHGILGAYIPEFDALNCLVQYDLYHRYTVDEHTLHSIEALERLATSSEPSLQPLAHLYQQTANKALLKFALLLHDLGKDIGPRHASHVYRSGKLAKIVCERLSLTPQEQALLQVLVVNHLVMNHLAQRRDITDPKVIAEFANTVQTIPNLEQLYLLTFADTSAVGPEVWTVWKGALLSDLYHHTFEHFVYQTDTEPSKDELLVRLLPATIERLGPKFEVSLVEPFLRSMSTKYLMVTSPEHIAKHVRMTQPQLSQPVVIQTEHKQAADCTNITICVKEIRGVFSLIAGALSQNRLNILGAQIYTSSDGIAVDTLQVKPMDNVLAGDHRFWQQVETDLRTALTGKQYLEDTVVPRRYTTQERKLQVFAQPSSVIIDNAISDFYTVIEIQTQDRVGLLYNLTRLLFKQGLNITLAKISTEANKAIDVFYVTDEYGNKLLDDTKQKSIQQALIEAIERN